MNTDLLFLESAISDPELLQLILNGLFETLYMVFMSTLFAYVIGLPLGVILVVSSKNGIRPRPALYNVLGAVINILRSVPFLILLVMVIPVTRFITGTSIGSSATVVPLVIAAAPFIARLVESSLLEVDRGV
ncbi:MAG: methionine ABC transporter permease, partial [Lachnospiraceae bacterium]|nr:methionine ABC transporter permease [Lachnospiraceae bacterium]